MVMFQTEMLPLKSFSILERENNSNFLIWSYPTITNEIKSILLSKCFNNQIKSDQFYCLRQKNNFLYINQVSANETPTIAIVLVTSDYDLNKYKDILNIFTAIFLKNRNGVEIVQSYLKLFTNFGCCSYEENGMLMSCDLKNYKRNDDVIVKELIQDFGMEIILIYTAILLKRRILVYNSNDDKDSIENLQNSMLAMSRLVPCRNLQDYIVPLIENSAELKGLSFFLAGTVNEEDNQKQIYDIFVNLPTKEISINPNSKDIFGMTKLQKDLAIFMVNQADCEDESIGVITEKLAEKTNDILRELNSIAKNNSNMLTINDLKGKRFNPKLENFLFNLGIAEGIMMV